MMIKSYKALLLDKYLDLILQMILDLASLIFVAAFLMQLSLYENCYSFCYIRPLIFILF